MKKILLLLFACIMAATAMAQSQHLKFMGIPIDGTINQFEQKLIAKGFKNERELNANIPMGQRAFSGIMAGYKVLIGVSYEPRSKTVYQIGVVFSRGSESTLDVLEYEITDLLDEKYAEWESGELEGTDTSVWRSDVGQILMWTSVDDDDDSYLLFLRYVDKTNIEKYQETEDEDL